MSVILYHNRHFKDYWNGSKNPLTTWMLLEDNGTEDGGEVLAEFRAKEHAKIFCAAMGWEVSE